MNTEQNQTPFRFLMQQIVRCKGELGTIIGRAEHANGEPTYLVCDIIQKIGPCIAKQVSQHMPEVNIENVYKYCSRAIGYRLVSVDRSGPWKIFSIVDKSVEKPAPEPEKRPEIHQLHGIWR